MACPVQFLCRGLRTVGLVLLYYVFSIGITFYNKWLMKVSEEVHKALLASDSYTVPLHRTCPLLFKRVKENNQTWICALVAWLVPRLRHVVFLSYGGSKVDCIPMSQGSGPWVCPNPDTVGNYLSKLGNPCLRWPCLFFFLSLRDSTIPSSWRWFTSPSTSACRPWRDGPCSAGQGNPALFWAGQITSLKWLPQVRF